MNMKRSAGILLPIASLYSEYGIGTMGKTAYEFIDFLSDAGQSWWQILPVGPTGYGDSPYQSFSTYAGNPYLIDLNMLAEEGLLSREYLSEFDWGSSASETDYEKIYNSRFTVLKAAYEEFLKRGETEELDKFIDENSSWLENYTLYMAIKRHFDMKCWTDWEDEDVKLRKADRMEYYRNLLKDDTGLFAFIQYEFFRQWERLRKYAGEKGIGIIGDMPIYVAMDSADVWSEPEYFLLDEKNIPVEVAGVPPDYFSKDGQLWGNPLYDWEKMKSDGYGWWIRRIAAAARLYDVLRIDHFRGIESFWAVPYGEATARNGRWVKGPGEALVNVFKDNFPDLSFIAEDLGFLTEEVKSLLEASGFPGMKVLEFAFDSREPGDYLPHNYGVNCVCYTGTHDNSPLMGWRYEAAKEDIDFAVEYLGLNEEEGFNRGVLRGGLSSVSMLFIAQLQDYLGLNSSARINTPGIPGGNWKWRLEKDMIEEGLADRIRNMMRIYGRL